MVPINNRIGDYLVILKLKDQYENPIINNSIFLLLTEDEFMEHANTELRMLKKIFDCKHGQDAEAKIILNDGIKRERIELFIDTYNLYKNSTRFKFENYTISDGLRMEIVCINNSELFKIEK